VNSPPSLLEMSELIASLRIIVVSELTLRIMGRSLNSAAGHQISIYIIS
jgi:hypothetical protein